MPKPKRGFALIITITLMMLLVVIAVGLLGLSSISLRASAGSSAMAQARQHARVALMVALGELQKHAGPDQRITGVADLAGNASGDALAAGAAPVNNNSINGVAKGLTAVQPGTRYWTGVWKNSNETNPGTEIYTKTPSPKFIQWLVSGNEPGSTLAYTPASGACVVAGGNSIPDAKSAVVLVGNRTVGNVLDDCVAVPLVGITATKDGNPQLVGRYGWWVGDEGVKAKINVPRTESEPTNYAALVAQRRGWEAVSGFSNYPTPDSQTHEQLPKVISLQEAALLLSGGGGSSASATPLQSVFHSATTDSCAVVADALNGGAKIDLSAILAEDLPTKNPVSTIANYPVKNANIIPAARGRDLIAPKWDALKDFHDRAKALENGDLIVKSATSATTASIAPLITDIRVLMGIRFAAADTGSGFKATACGKVAIAIANPYSVPLRWKNDLEIELRDQTPAGNQPSRIYNLGNAAPFIDRDQAAVFNNAFFRIRPGTLAPGECRAYTLDGYTLRSVSSGTQRTVINLAPFGGASPFDFTRCVELENTAVYTSFPLLDIRESWQTTLMGVEMRLAGGTSRSQPLRFVERFELDNAFFQENTRNQNYSYPTDYQRRNKPIPLMCYSFQISQPGVDYLNLMPSGYELGQRGSSLRTFTDFNLQATRIGKPIASYNPPPYFMESNDGFAQLPDTPPGGDTGMAFTKNLDSVMPWGRAWNGSRNTILFSVPNQLVSLAQFQHADLTGDDVAASIGHQPGNAFGNSYATPFVKRAQTSQARFDYEIIGSPNTSGALTYQPPLPNKARNYYDISYLLNAAVWDSYFLSTIPRSGSTEPVNPSILRLKPDAPSTALMSPVECASAVMIDGAFNVNCTEKNAWKAFLASSKHFTHKADTDKQATAAFPRTLEQSSPAANPPTGADADSFSGYRRLTDDELDALADEIVKQVRLRGPFVSLSHFVNRALSDLGNRRGASPALTRSGALQTAIDESGITINSAGNKKALSRVNIRTDRLNLSEKNSAPRADMDGGDTSYQLPNADSSNPDWAVTSKDNNFGSVASIIADRTMLNSAKNEQGYRSTGIPGWLTQADVLQVIGPSLTIRSDTFRIRAYGESVDASGKTIARAWCEAIVQRMPDYLDPSNPASARGIALSSLNKIHGRQFHIVSFRWLSQDEI